MEFLQALWVIFVIGVTIFLLVLANGMCRNARKEEDEDGNLVWVHDRADPRLFGQAFTFLFVAFLVLIFLFDCCTGFPTCLYKQEQQQKKPSTFQYP